MVLLPGYMQKKPERWNMNILMPFKVKHRGLPALIILNPCSNFLGFSIEYYRMYGLRDLTSPCSGAGARILTATEESVAYLRCVGHLEG